MSHDPNCVFCKIIAGEIPSKKVYEDEELFAFHDIRPHAPIHFMIVPKIHVPSLNEVTAQQAPLLGRILTLVPKLALEQGCVNGFRTMINTGADGGQEVFHLHIHVMGGPRPWRIG